MTSSRLPEAVVSAIKASDLARLEKLYESDMSLEEIASQAAQDKKPRVLEWCYSQGWKPKQPSFNYDFFSCAKSGASPAVFQVLLDHGWDFNAHESEYSGDALSYAVQSRDYGFAKWLLEHGHRATPVGGNYDDPASWTTLGIRGEPDLRMLRLLLDHGIDLKDQGSVCAAANVGNLEGLKMVLDYGVDTEDRGSAWSPFDEGEEDDPYKTEGTGLYRACRQGHLECARLLIERGANVQAKDDGGTSCLTIARQRGHQEIVKLLEENGVTE
jgi:hypothetical protein